MKNLSFLSIAFLIFSTFFFSSCEKEEELSTKDKLIGTWKYEFRKYEQYVAGELVSSGIDTVRGTTIRFQRNDTQITTVEVPDQPAVVVGGIWTLNGDSKIVLGDIGNRDILEIKELTETTMILIQEEEIIEDDGIAYGYKDEVSFIKQ